MASRPEKWPQAVDELLPNTLFRLAAQYPDLTYSEYPRTKNATDGYRKITFKEVANAVHSVAWWIDQNVGKPANDDGSETLVYMGPNDLRYGILVLGSVMVGYKMLFPTPRYGVEALTTLISSANGSVMLTPSAPFPVVSEILAKRSMRTFEIPLVEHFLNSEPAPYPFTKTFQSNRQEPLVCLHTSGTTGFPKPVIWTHDWANSVAKGFYLPASAGYERLDEIMLGPQRRVMTLFPQFHASGIIGALIFQLVLGTTVVCAPSRMTPNEVVDATADALEVLGEERKIDVLALPPMHAEYLGMNAALLGAVSKRVKTILWSGGDLSHAAGNAIAAKLQIVNQMASTEMALWTAVRKSGPDDVRMVDNEWQYLTFHPSLNIRFDAASEGEEGAHYEAIMVKNEGESAWIQPIFKVFNEIKEITLGDLFIRHPHNLEKWKHAGRADDLLNFLTGETFHPGSAEQRIAGHPDIAEVLIVGTKRPKASLIVRLNNGADLENVWEVIDEVNKDSPIYARVGRHMILVVIEPFSRTAKGTIRKKSVVDLYGKELDVLYEKDESLILTR